MNKEYKALAVLAARLAESVLMDWNKEEQVKLSKEVATKCHSIFNDKESREFVSLVKWMRESQKNFNNIRFIDKSSESYKDAKKSRKQLESEVDEYLKKMESIDQRKALETENTEFEYGHNVKHYSED
jgi:phosphorylcholine metabolism protein LicD